jgi:hypothetical protein
VAAIQPSLYGAIAEELEVLCAACGGRFGMIEGVGHADTFDGTLLDAVDLDRLGNVDGIEHGGEDIDYVMPLGSHGADIFNLCKPGNHHAVAGSAVMGCNLLGPLEWSIEGDGLADGEVVIGLPGSEVVDMRENLLGSLNDAVHGAFEVQ